MVSLTIRNIPEEILKRIRIFAAKERRSLNSEMLIVIEEGLSARISEKTGTNSEGNASFVSSAGREKIWEELCGAWQDTRNFNEIRDQIYRDRENIGREIKTRNNLGERGVFQ